MGSLRLTDGVVDALDLEPRIGDPPADVCELPLPADLVDAHLVAPVGQPAAEPAHLRPHHPQPPGPAGHVEQELLSLRVHVDGPAGVDGVLLGRGRLEEGVVDAQADKLGRVGLAASGHRHRRAASWKKYIK